MFVPIASRWDRARDTASSYRPAVRAATSPAPAVLNNTTKASAAMVKATSTSSRVKPRSRGIGHAHCAIEPVDADRDLVPAILERDAAAGGAAVGVEADAGDHLGADLAGLRRDRDREAARQMLRPRRADRIGPVLDVDGHDHRAIGADGPRPRLAQRFGDVRSGMAEAEAVAAEQIGRASCRER